MYFESMLLCCWGTALDKYAVHLCKSLLIQLNNPCVGSK